MSTPHLPQGTFTLGMAQHNFQVFCPKFGGFPQLNTLALDSICSICQVTQSVFAAAVMRLFVCVSTSVLVLVAQSTISRRNYKHICQTALLILASRHCIPRLNPISSESYKVSDWGVPAPPVRPRSDNKSES